MWHHALNEEGVAIGSGVVEGGLQGPRCAAPEALGHALAESQRIGGQAICALIKPGLFDRSWGAFMGARCGPANDNISASEDWKQPHDISYRHAGLTAPHIHRGGTHSTQFPQFRWTSESARPNGRAVRRLHKDLHQWPQPFPQNCANA